MAMAMAIPQSRATTKPATSYYMCLFIIITVATVNKPTLAGSLLKASPPSTLVVYVHENRLPGPGQTSPVVVSPPGGSEFGTIAVVADVLREGQAGDSPVLGQLSGQVIFEKDTSLYQSVAFVLDTPSCAGSITAQGTTDSLGNGEVAITGGTGDFRWAKGYFELRLLSQENLHDIVYKATLYIRYIRI